MSVDAPEKNEYPRASSKKMVFKQITYNDKIMVILSKIHIQNIICE